MSGLPATYQENGQNRVLYLPPLMDDERKKFALFLDELCQNCLNDYPFNQYNFSYVRVMMLSDGMIRLYIRKMMMGRDTRREIVQIGGEIFSLFVKCTSMHALGRSDVWQEKFDLFQEAFGLIPRSTK